MNLTRCCEVLLLKKWGSTTVTFSDVSANLSISMQENVQCINISTTWEQTDNIWAKSEKWNEYVFSDKSHNGAYKMTFYL